MTTVQLSFVLLHWLTTVNGYIIETLKPHRGTRKFMAITFIDTCMYGILLGTAYNVCVCVCGGYT